MSKMLRLTKEEERVLGKKCIEVNKVLIGMNHQPVKESELIHRILSTAIKHTTVDKNGIFKIDF